MAQSMCNENFTLKTTHTQKKKKKKTTQLVIYRKLGLATSKLKWIKEFPS